MASRLERGVCHGGFTEKNYVNAYRNTVLATEARIFCPSCAASCSVILAGRSAQRKVNQSRVEWPVSDTCRWMMVNGYLMATQGRTWYPSFDLDLWQTLSDNHAWHFPGKDVLFPIPFGEFFSDFMSDCFWVCFCFSSCSLFFMLLRFSASLLFCFFAFTLLRSVFFRLSLRLWPPCFSSFSLVLHKLNSTTAPKPTLSRL